MDQLITFFNTIHGGILTSILLIIMIFDTVFALKSRIKDGKFLSSRLLTGSISNIFIAIIPAACDLLIKITDLNNIDIFCIRLVMICSFVAVFLGIFGSCITNYSIAFPNAKIAAKIVEKFLPAELEAKVKGFEDTINSDVSADAKNEAVKVSEDSQNGSRQSHATTIS